MKKAAIKLPLTAVLISLTTLFCSCSSSEQSMPDFRVLKPFKGRVTKVEKIAWESNYRLHSASGPDFRVTVTTARGSTIIVKRVHTQVLQEDRLRKLVDKAQCDLPEDIVQCEDRIGRDSY